MADELTFRPMTRDEVGLLVGWAADEGWNPGLHDAELFWQTDPAAFVAAELGGELIGGGAIVKYASSFGFMGLFIVRPPFRGRGLGGRLWYQRRRQLKERLGPGATIGMDGVFEMRDWYAVGGFKFAHRSIRYESTGVALAPAAGVLPLADIPFEDVAAYDAKCFPAPREGFLRSWISQPDSLALGVVEGGSLRGFGVARRCGHGTKIGPLFADDGDQAEALFTGLAGLAPGEPLFIDVPENNRAAMALAARHGMSEVFGTARMYAGPVPPIEHGRVFGGTTFELG
jgi:hypothetical protein